MLQAILRYQQDTGKSLGDLVKEIERQNAVQQQLTGPSPVDRDLSVARALLVAARRCVNSDDRDGALALLNRLEATVNTLQAEIPAAQMRAFLERAAFALQGSSLGVEADVASASVLAALDVALKSPNAALVPPVVQDLEKTKAQVDRGAYKEGLAAIQQLTQTVMGHVSVRLLRNAAAGVRGAREAMEREAGLVVLAELDQLSDGFNRFATALKAAPPAPAAPEGAANMEAQPAETVPAEPTAPEGTPAPASPTQKPAT
ncbi:hypothetical protein LLH03_00525 [bacterium]|nr:hypothetical protein [bacterium]